MTDLNPADLGPDIGSPVDPVAQLAAHVAQAKAEAAAKADEPVTIADVAAAAFVALETIVAMLPETARQQVIDQFEQRAALFATSLEEGEL